MAETLSVPLDCVPEMDAVPLTPDGAPVSCTMRESVKPAPRVMVSVTGTTVPPGSTMMLAGEAAIVKLPFAASPGASDGSVPSLPESGGLVESPLPTHAATAPPERSARTISRRKYFDMTPLY